MSKNHIANLPVRVSSSPQWLTESQVNHNQLPERVAPWLFERHSLTFRIQSRCPRPFAVRVLSQEFAVPRWHEGRELQQPEGQCCFIRQVFLECAGTPVVYARTIIPLATLTGAEKRLANLKNQPLGAVLFADRSMRRKPLQIARFVPGHYIYDVAVQPLDERPAGIWGRRSVYYLHGKSLLVSEVFLPSIERCRE